MHDERKYYPTFDYLRIVLAITVAVGHSGIVFWDQAGNYAVQIFFALSGWLIGGILVRLKSEDLPRFYFNRAARIWIPYFVAIGLLALASLLKERVTPKWLEIIFYDVTFVYNFFGPPQLALTKEVMPLQGTGNHFWSICAEEQFYVLSPLLIVGLSRVGRSAWFWCGVSFIALVSPYSGYFSSISLGVLAAVAQVRLGDWHNGRTARTVLLFLSLVLFLITYENWLFPYEAVSPFSAVVIILLLAQAGRISKAATFVGGISFPMYLNHWIGVFAANALFSKFGQRDTLFCHLTGVLLSLAVASLLYVSIDCRLKNNRDTYFTSQRGVLAAILGAFLIVSGMIGGFALFPSY